jgi:hypothetical protein
MPLGTGFTYQGRLNSSGVPVNATADFQFSLWNAASAGVQVGSTVAVNNLSISNGLFTVTLDFGWSAFNGDARWLQIALRSPAGGGAFTTLTPRQSITVAPYALQTRRLFVNGAGDVGIGTTTPGWRLSVNGGGLSVFDDAGQGINSRWAGALSCISSGLSS